MKYKKDYTFKKKIFHYAGARAQGSQPRNLPALRKLQYTNLAQKTYWSIARKQIRDETSKTQNSNKLG